MLASGERIEKAYQLIRDLFVFTNKRLLLVDEQVLTGNKVEYHSLPYKNITHFSVETAGHFDLDVELKIWISGSPLPIEKRFFRFSRRCRLRPHAARTRTEAGWRTARGSTGTSASTGGSSGC